MSSTLLMITAAAITFHQVLLPVVASYNPYTRIINDVGHEYMNSVEHKGNMLVSPVSIYIGLAMIHLGAKGKTKEQVEDALKLRFRGFPTPDLHVNSIQLEYSRKSRDDYNLSMANGIFIEDDYPVKSTFVRNVRSFYNALANRVNFNKDPAGTRDKINEWASSQTRGNVPELLTVNPDPETKIAIMNAIYFKGIWKKQFDPKRTVIGKFYNFGNGFSVANLMQMLDVSFNYFADYESGYNFLELPYRSPRGRDISMLLALPEDSKTFPDLKMSNSVLNRVCDNLERTRLSMVVLPKFHLEYDTQLEKSLRSMGIVDLFTKDANLKGIFDEELVYENLKVDSVFHKAVIEVNEEGTDSAALSEILDYTKSRTVPGPEFIANRPFTFYILDRRLNMILFVGRLVEA